MKRRLFFKNILLLSSFPFLKSNASIQYGKISFQKTVKNVYILDPLHKINNTLGQCSVHKLAFIEAKNGIIVIDSGANYAVGKAILFQIAQISAKPIIAILNTHHHSDHWFGNGAIKEKYPNVKIYAHKNFIDSAQEQYFNKYRKKRSYQKAKKVAFPNIFVKNNETLTIDSETFFIQHPSFAHTDCDITITHINSNVIFLGDVALESSLGNFAKGSSILTNITFLEKVSKQKTYALYVAGHGSLGSKEKVIIPYLTYLTIIKDEVEKAYNEEKTLYELDACKERVLERLNWEDGFNFPLSFVQSHIEFVYGELERKF